MDFLIFMAAYVLVSGMWFLFETTRAMDVPEDMDF